MSTIRANKYENTSTSDGGISIDNSGHVTIDGQQLPTAGALSHRNLVANGAMTVAQRGTSKTGLTDGNTGYYTVDRFQWLEQGSPTYVQTMSQSTDSPVGFSNSLKLETTTADTASTGLKANAITYIFEGQDLQSLAYGTTSAKSFTLSFWVKSSVTGTYVVWLYNADQTRSCTQSYTIDTANTWEYKTITVAGDTSSGFDNDNGGSLYVRWVLGAGSDFTSGTASTTWISGNVNADKYVGQTANIFGAVGNTWQITGVQLEVGEKATPFEHRNFGDELARCQRYFVKSGNIGTAAEWFPGVATHAEHGRVTALALDGQNDRAVIIDRFPTTMRAAGSATFYPGRDQVTNTAGNITVYNGNTSVTTTGKPIPSTRGFEAYFTGTSTDARAYTLQYTVDSEL